MLNRFSSVPVAMCCAAVLAAVGVGGVALGQTYDNSGLISIPAVGTATPYPSTINVVGGPASMNRFSVTLRGFNHTFPGDVRVLLVAPSGQAVQLLSNNGGGADAVNLTFEFSSASVAALPFPLASGTFAAAGGTNSYPSPAPVPPFLASLGALAGSNSNGVWKLYVNDTAGGDSGSFSGGWTLDFADTITPITPNTFTYQGKLTGGAANGSVDARFTVFDSVSGTSILNRVGVPSTVTGVPLIDGVFTAPVNPGVVIPTDRKTWLQVDVANPSGSAFVALSPRQPLAPAPVAARAVTLDFDTGLLIGSSRVVVGQHATENQGGKSRFGYAVNASGLNEFIGMQPIIAPGTANCGNSGDIGFFTWECNTSASREVARMNGTGNLGIGTAAPVEKLDVRGSIAMGADGSLRAASGIEDLRLLRGTFAFGANILAGSGFAVARPSTGTYTITFDTPFGGVPSISASAFDTGLPLTIAIATVTATDATILVRNNVGTPTNAQISFTVMGPR